MPVNIFSKKLPSLVFRSSRYMGKLTKVIYPWMNRRKPYWVDEKADPRSDESLSEANKAFLEEERLRMINESTPISVEQFKQTPWIPNVTQRCGLIAIKLGIYPMWTKVGKKLNCTLFQIPDNHAIQYTPPMEIDDHLSLRAPRPDWIHNKRIPSWIAQRRWGIQLVGAVSADPAEFSSAWCGLFKKAGVPPKRKLSRFLVSEDAALQPGTPLGVHHFRVGDYLDVTARTINRGFQGVIERWGMSGGPAAHGSTRFHRRMGSAAGAGRAIVRGKRMPGVMGNRYRSLRGLLVVRINPKLGLIYVVGPVPGPVHAYCLLHDSWLVNRRRRLDENPPPVPTYFPSDENLEEQLVLAAENFDDFEFDIYHDMIHRSDAPTISYSES